MKTQPKYKVCRRLGPGIYDKCQTQKFTLSEAKKDAAKRRGGGRRRRPLSEYGSQLLEKQRARLSYGVTERQFRRYINEALESKKDPTEWLYSRLEKRLDNVLYRSGIAPTRRFARQLVSHGHFLANGRKVKIPSLEVSKGDSITIREGSKDKGPFLELEKKLEDKTSPGWIVFDEKAGKISIKGEPNAKEQQIPFDFTSIIEFYRR